MNRRYPYLRYGPQRRHWTAILRGVLLDLGHTALSLLASLVVVGVPALLLVWLLIRLNVFGS